MKFQVLNTPKQAEMPLAPVINLIVLLVIFFVESWKFAHSELEREVKLPAAQMAERNRKPGEIIVNLMEGGGIRVGHQDLTGRELECRLSRLSNGFPGLPVILRVDRCAHFKKVMEVLEACERAGVQNLAFAARKQESAGKGDAP
jgi:biopolymer transport protein ExbD